LHLPDPWRPASFAARLQSLGVIVLPAEAFATDPARAPNAVRICLGAEPSRERLLGAIHRIAGALLQLPAHSEVVT
jgi:DNA-binding transcriptional MocR family regulator